MDVEPGMLLQAALPVVVLDPPLEGRGLCLGTPLAMGPKLEAAGPPDTLLLLLGPAVITRVLWQGGPQVFRPKLPPWWCLVLEALPLSSEMLSALKRQLRSGVAALFSEPIGAAEIPALEDAELVMPRVEPCC
uniref:Uncharacterized protein n=1 Tax=Rousettus aegyptiacus TaxID=9407 RepID=A0A7J8H0L0_ROUAE|nr:hypothetical protein HJG63_011209 [Rousettus aegyptiacus]